MQKLAWKLCFYVTITEQRPIWTLQIELIAKIRMQHCNWFHFFPLTACPPPPQPENGGYTCHPSPCRWFSHGTVIQYYCNEGYTMKGDYKFRTCHYGKWDDSVPVSCVPELAKGRINVHWGPLSGCVVNMVLEFNPVYWILIWSICIVLLRLYQTAVAARLIQCDRHEQELVPSGNSAAVQLRPRLPAGGIQHPYLHLNETLVCWASSLHSHWR